MSDFQKRTLTLEEKSDAEMVTKGLAMHVRHPTDARARASRLEAMARTPRQKAAVAAITSTNYDVFGLRFLNGPARRRVLAELLARGGSEVPPHARLQSSPSDPQGQWIGGGLPIPLANIDFETTFTESSKFGFLLAVADSEQLSDEDFARLVEPLAVDGLVTTEDRKLLGTDAAVVGTNPGGLLATAPEIGGGSPSELETALEEAFGRVDPRRGVLVAAPRIALWMALQKTESGARFPNARVDGTGDIGGIPLLTSRAAGNKLILIDASALVVVDNGFEVSASKSAAVQMDDNPSVGAQVVSGFQTDTTFLKFIRRVWWALLRDDAIAYITLPFDNSPN